MGLYFVALDCKGQSVARFDDRGAALGADRQGGGLNKRFRRSCLPRLLHPAFYEDVFSICCQVVNDGLSALHFDSEVFAVVQCLRGGCGASCQQTSQHDGQHKNF